MDCRRFLPAGIVSTKVKVEHPIVSDVRRVLEDVLGTGKPSLFTPSTRDPRGVEVWDLLREYVRMLDEFAPGIPMADQHLVELVYGHRSGAPGTLHVSRMAGDTVLLSFHEQAPALVAFLIEYASYLEGVVLERQVDDKQNQRTRRTLLIGGSPP